MYLGTINIGSLEPELQVTVSPPTWGLGTKVRSFAEAVHSLNHQESFQPPTPIPIFKGDQMATSVLSTSSTIDFCENFTLEIT